MIFSGKAGVSEWMNHQLATYENYMLALRQIDIFDAADSEKILVPYMVAFRKNDRLVIYGAGVLGAEDIPLS